MYLFGRPVMRHFFLEKFPRASDWFEKRLAYTHSVAVCSMVMADFTRLLFDLNSHDLLPSLGRLHCWIGR